MNLYWNLNLEIMKYIKKIKIYYSKSKQLKYGIIEYVHPVSNRTSYKSVKLEDVGSDWFDCLTDDEQSWVQQRKKVD